MAEKKGSSSEKVLYCSFCGKSQHEVKKLIAGPSVFICDECIELCNDIIRDEVPAEAADREVGQVRPADPERDQGQPRPVRDRPGGRQAHALGRGLQPLQAAQAHEPHQGRDRALEEQHPADRPDRLGQDAAGADAGAPAQRAVRDRRRDDADRSRLRRRRRREHHPEAAAELRLRRREGAARHRLHRRDRQDQRARPTTRRSRATSRARACSRRC